jgi:hypothetical protein
MTRTRQDGQGMFAMRELEAGVKAWVKRGWPKDFHNSLYQWLATLDPNGEFTMDWWDRLYPTLRAWRATRPFPRSLLTARFAQRAEAIRAAWQASCAPRASLNIETVRWEQVADFANVVAGIKPTLSPVFRSKLCHFRLPTVFPVVDRTTLGPWSRLSYRDYYLSVQKEWRDTPDEVRVELIAYLKGQISDHIGATRATVYSGFPWACKIIELRRVGRASLAR